MKLNSMSSFVKKYKEINHIIWINSEGYVMCIRKKMKFVHIAEFCESRDFFRKNY